jgi:hypothetical protein
MAPEVISSTHYDNRCDVFSFGIIMFQTLTQCSDNDIYPINKLNGKNIDFMLSTDPNFRPVINENLNSNQEFIDYRVKNLTFNKIKTFNKKNLPSNKFIYFFNSILIFFNSVPIFISFI